MTTSTDDEQLIRDAEAARARIGEPLLPAEQWVTIASAEAIRRFALGGGDDNPLFCDPAYAAGTAHGGVIAPPFFPLAAESLAPPQVLAQYLALFLGTRIRMHRPIAAGTRILSDGGLSDITIKQRPTGAPLVLESWDMRYVDEQGEPLATVTHTASRMTSKGDVDPLDADEPEDAEGAEALAALAARVRAVRAAHRRRGAQRRTVADVAVGESIGQFAYGPLTTLDFAAKIAQMGQRAVTALDFARANDASRRTGATPFPLDGGTGFRVYQATRHYDREMARAAGILDTFDQGMARQTWTSRLVTDWAGDDGFVTEIEVQIRRQLFRGQAYFVTGTVAEVLEEDSCVRVDLVGTNERDDVVTKGSALVRLPGAR